MATKPLSIEQLRKTVDALKEIENKHLYRAMDFYVPYAKQLEFHNAGCFHSERYMRAGNRVGKSHCGGAEMAYHLTGEYPEWWLGKRFNRPVKAWASSVTGLAVRDVVQEKLCGSPGIIAAQGTGMIPKDAVNWAKESSLARGITDLYDTISVQHKTNGIKDGKSILQFKTYEQGRQKWQGAAVDVIWFDEEPDEDVYFEGLARLAPTKPGEAGGISFLTSTPLLGVTKLVERFRDEVSEDRAMIIMDMKDALHMDAAARKVILDRYARHERASREHGDPLQGSGLIFVTPVEAMEEFRPDPMPSHWWYGWGIDFGIFHPFAAVLMGWDKDADCIHVLHSIRMKDSRPIDHWAAMKPIGETVPVSWPQDGHQREKGSAEHLYTIYKKQGLHMMATHAVNKDGSNGTEAAIIEMEGYMSTGRFKVAKHLTEWWEEYRGYHRKDGMIVKERDDIMSATRVGFMMRRHFKQLSYLNPYSADKLRSSKIAKGVDTGSHFGV